MNSLNEKTVTVSVQFRRKLLMLVKNYPILWHKSKNKKNVNTQSRDAWKTIEREMGYPCSLKEIQATWASLSEMYFRIIFLKTIERSFEPPVWQFFHEMTFLYDHVKETIQNQLGGISPPLFKSNGSQGAQCPCCVYVGSDLNSAPDMSSIQFKQEDEFENIITATSETLFENCQKAIDSPIGSIDTESDNSMGSTGAANSQESEPEHNENKTVQPPAQDLDKDKTLEVPERYSDGIKKSSWESFDKLEFLQENIDVIQRPRDKKNTIEEKVEESLYSDITISEPIKPVIKDKEVSNKSNSANDSAQFLIPPKRSVACINGISNIQILSVESLSSVNPIKNDCKKPKQLENPASFVEPSTMSILQYRPIDVIELMDDTEGNNKSSNSQLQLESQTNVTDYHSTKEDIIYSVESPTIKLSNSINPEIPEFPELSVSAFKYSADIKSSVEDDGSIKKPAIGSNEQIISPKFSEITSQGVLVLNDTSKGKEIKRLVASVNKLRAIKRSQIIAAVKANPATYLYDCTKRRRQFIEAWQKVSKELGNLPYETLRNRWKLIKYRYIKELIFERNSRGTQKSSWECYDELEFLRPHIQKDFEEIYRTRQQMNNLLEKRAQESIPGDNTTPKPTEPIAVDTTIIMPNISYVKGSTNDQTPFCIRTKTPVANTNESPNIQKASVETLSSINHIRTDCKNPKQLKTLVILDPNTLPILKNRPFKVTAVKVLPSTNENDKNVKNKSNDNTEVQLPAKKLRTITGTERNKTHVVLANETPKRLPSDPIFKLSLNMVTSKPATTVKLNDDSEAQPPAKKLRNSTGSDRNETHVLAIETPKRRPSAPVSSLNLAMNTLKPATIPMLNLFEKNNSQNVFPTLDLTLDDELPVTVPTSDLNKIATAKFQHEDSVHENDCIYTCKVFPTLDLTTDENDDDDKNASNNEIISKNGNKVDEENVICLDDDDSVSSCGEAIRKDKN